ncbi:MAG: hypothetical protein V1716_05645 [Candidatus Uhrbacteria bacterium]
MSNKAKIFLIISVDLLLLSIVAGVYFYFSNLKPKPTAGVNLIVNSSPAVSSSTTTVIPTNEEVSWTRGSGENEFWVTNPTTKAKLYVKVFYPTNFENDTVNALVFVPGGTGDSNTFTGKKGLNVITESGLIAVVFDPDGRGKSEGEENQDGYNHQDGLATIIKFVANELPDAKVEKIGVASYSFGLVMASGALSRYPELPVSFLVDWEGPIDRNDFAGCDADLTGHLKGQVACDDEEFMAEREAINFVPKLKIPYQRLESETDHAQPDVLSAIRIVNDAVSGDVPWVRLNDYTVNQTFSEASPPEMLSNDLDKKTMDTFLEYAKELFAI